MAFTPEMKAIGDRMEARRSRLGLTQQDVADRLDILLGTYRQWESGTNPMPAIYLQRVARVLCCPVGAFFEDDARHWEDYFAEQALRAQLEKMVPKS